MRGVARNVILPGSTPAVVAAVRIRVARVQWVRGRLRSLGGPGRGYGSGGFGRDRQSRRTRQRRSAPTPAAHGRLDPASARIPWSGMEIVTSHNAEARYCQKAGKAEWIGYRDHQSETCEPNGLNVIVYAVTRPAPEQDIDALNAVHAALIAQGLTPTGHVVDTGCITPDVIHHAAVRWGISPLGPVRSDPRERPGFAKQDFRGPGGRILTGGGEVGDALPHLRQRGRYQPRAVRANRWGGGG